MSASWPAGQVLSPQHAGRRGEGFAKAPVLAEVSLLPMGPDQVATGAQHAGLTRHVQGASAAL